MKIYQKTHVMRLVQFASNPRDMRIIAVMGPRQIGKTTIAHQAMSLFEELGINCKYISFDDPSTLKSEIPSDSPVFDTAASVKLTQPNILVDIWENARKESLKSKNGFILFLDEIQLVPQWSNYVKGLWDRDRRENTPLRIVILGSSVWQMLVGRNESLVGRFRQLLVSHWSLREMMDQFGLTVDEYIFYGGYPGPFTQSLKGVKDEKFWRTYILESIVNPVIQRDIMSLRQIRKPALMRQLVNMVPQYSAQIMEYNKLIGMLQDKGNTTTIKNYLDLLGDAFLVSTLSRYTPSQYLGIASHPKFNVLNTALMTAPSGNTFIDARDNPSQWGRIVESAVGAHLINTRQDQATRVHYWRDDHGHEVDFIVARGPHLLGIEVKSGSKSSYRGLNAFKERFPNAKTVLIGGGGISISEFLSFTTDQWIEQVG